MILFVFMRNQWNFVAIFLVPTTSIIFILHKGKNIISDLGVIYRSVNIKINFNAIKGGDEKGRSSR